MGSQVTVYIRSPDASGSEEEHVEPEFIGGVNVAAMIVQADGRLWPSVFAIDVMYAIVRQDVRARTVVSV